MLTLTRVKTKQHPDIQIVAAIVRLFLWAKEIIYD
nr:MAG TPA: hypothetical protein [Caudoviricetes sp.]